MTKWGKDKNPANLLIVEIVVKTKKATTPKSPPEGRAVKFYEFSLHSVRNATLGRKSE